jgi:hypothetical protein
MAATTFLKGVNKVVSAFPFEFEQIPLESVFSSNGDDYDDETIVAMTPTRQQTGSIFAESKITSLLSSILINNTYIYTAFQAVRQHSSLSNAQKLRLLFTQAQSLSAREDLLFYLRQRVLRTVAERRK